MPSPSASAVSDPTASEKVLQAKEQLDRHVRDMVQWHFDPATGCLFWLDFAAKLGWDPKEEIRSFADLRRFPPFQDEWLRGGPVERWIPRGLAGMPAYVFETGGTTGIPKSRVQIEDFRIDYELFGETLPEKYFPLGSNWLMLGPSGPRRLRLAVEHLCQHRGGICFCVDLDPRWVIKLIKAGRVQDLEHYKAHVIEQAVTILQAGHEIRCMFTTPKLLEALAEELDERGTSIREIGITGIFAGGTEFTPQFTRFAMEELLGSGVYMTPTYGNTLMGLACSKPITAEDGYKISYYAPQPRAVIEVVSFDDANRVVDYGKTGRVRLTTLTRETFIPGFLERDEGEREPPYETYPWDGVSGVRPYRQTTGGTVVGVY
jgi:phenylacetate-coenzyme A ligase PaaK-like adenylate-forming protein